jgi:citryl-CoA lyase
MKIKTRIADIQSDGAEIIRGYTLTDLISNKSFPEVIFLLLKGKLPSIDETKMFNAILTAIIDHGPAVASAMNARISASAKNDLHTAVAAGLLGLGERHGVVIEQSMRFFYDHLKEKDWEGLLKKMKEEKKYLSGYGHKIFTSDPRTQNLFDLAYELKIAGPHVGLAQHIENVLATIQSKKIPLNADGAIAAILCDMGFDYRVGNGIFVIARVPGLVAHVVEECTNDEGIRRLDPEDIEYIGDSVRALD